MPEEHKPLLLISMNKYSLEETHLKFSIFNEQTERRSRLRLMKKIPTTEPGNSSNLFNLSRNYLPARSTSRILSFQYHLKLYKLHRNLVT